MADFLRHLPRAGGGANTSLDVSLASYSLSNDVHTSVSVKSEKNSVKHTQKNTKNTHMSVFNKQNSECVIPPYGERRNHKFYPKKISDFADGGAFPEIHITQYPLDLGKTDQSTSRTVPLLMGEDGKLEYDAVIKQNTEKTSVFSKPENQISMYTDKKLLVKPHKEEEDENIQQTLTAINTALNKHTQNNISNINVNNTTEYFKYTPNPNAPGHNKDCTQRIIKMVEKPKDPLEVAKFKHKRAPTGPPSPPPPVQHSPPRKLTMKDQQEWKIPPSVSNWKNKNGYTIPLDKRIQADGRGLQEVSINDKFASLSESLNIAERSAREEIRIRNEIIKQKKAEEEKNRELQLRELAAKARTERSNLMKQKEETAEETSARKQREQIERERKHEIERDHRLQKSGKRTKIGRDDNRDISERIALGQAQPTSQEMLYDARLFNQSSGLDTGYGGGIDDSYNIYDKPLFTDRAAAGIYQYSKERLEQNIGEHLNLPSFSGAVKGPSERIAPVEFEKDTADPFGLDNLLSEAKKGNTKK